MKAASILLTLLCSLHTFSQNWESSYDEAVSSAQNSNKPIVLVFAGSDWCAPCIKLEKEIWLSEEFKAYADKNYVLYRADFPRKKKNLLSKELSDSHSDLAARYNSKGYFPLVVVLNPKEQILGQTSYKKIPPKEYISLLNSFLE